LTSVEVDAIINTRRRGGVTATPTKKKFKISQKRLDNTRKVRYNRYMTQQKAICPKTQVFAPKSLQQ